MTLKIKKMIDKNSDDLLMSDSESLECGGLTCQCPINILNNSSMTIPVSPVSPATDVL